MKDSMLNKKKYRGIPIWEQGTSYALCSAIADNIHILKKDMYGNYSRRICMEIIALPMKQK